MSVDSHSTTLDVCVLLYDDRSGSTLLASLLANSEDLFVTLESMVFVRLIKWTAPLSSHEGLMALIESLYLEPKFQAWNIPRFAMDDALNALGPGITKRDVASLILRLALRQSGQPATKVLIKHGNVYTLDGWLELFGNCKFLHIIRDGRAVFCSKKNAIHSERNTPMARSPIYAAYTWSSRNALASEAISKAPYLLIKYEDLVADPLQALRSACAFLGLSLPSSTFASTRYSSAIPDTQKHLHGNLSREVNSASAHAWHDKLSKTEVIVFETFAARLLTKYGYPMTKRSASNIGIACLSMPKFILEFMTELLKNRITYFIHRTRRTTSRVA